MATLQKMLSGKEGYFYFVFRVLVGLLFMQHGLQKLFGLFGGLGGNSVALFSKMGAAGSIELAAGLLIVFGLLTRLSAIVAGIEILYVYITVHLSQGWIPILNGGELALLFFATFLVLIAYGAGKWGLDGVFFKKKEVKEAPAKKSKKKK